MRSRTLQNLAVLVLLPVIVPACSRGGAVGDEPPGLLDLATPSLDLRIMHGPDMAAGDMRKIFGPPTFAAPYNFASEGVFGAVAAADVNGDGVADAVLGDEPSRGGLAIYLGKGDGTLGARYRPGGTLPSAAVTFVVVSDLDGDSKLDIVANSYSPSMLLLGKGNGDGTFANTRSLPMPPTAEGIVVGDWDGDKRIDLAVSCALSSAACILFGGGDLTYAAPRQITVGQAPLGIVAGDLNGDKISDLVLTSYEGNALSILFGKGAGTFEPVVSVKTTDGPVHLTLADLNRDGALDVVHTSDRAGGVTVHLGTGSGTFLPYRKYNAALATYAHAVIDLNGDSLLDVATVDLQQNIVILIGDGAGALAEPVLVPTVTRPTGLAAGDFNRDGKPDLIVSSSNGRGGALHINTTAP